MTNSYREDVLPTSKQYSLVEIDLGAPVDEAASKLREFDDPEAISVPQDTNFELFVVYDQDGNEVSIASDGGGSD